MIEETVQGAHTIGVLTLGLRNMYSKKPIEKVEDMKGLKVRVQATGNIGLFFAATGGESGASVSVTWPRTSGRLSPGSGRRTV